MTVRYEGRIPATLRRYAEKHAHQIAEVTFGTVMQGEYEASLRRGWSKCDDTVHSVVSDTASGLISELRGVVACDCEECR